MISVRVGRLEDVTTQAVLRPIASDGSAPTPSMRRLEAVAGDKVAEHLARLGELPVGSATLTPAGGLPADFLVSVVVRSRDEPATTASVERALVNGLRRVRDLGLTEIAMAPLGTGAGNLEIDAAAPIMLRVLGGDADGALDATIVVESDYEREVLERLGALRAE